MNRQTAGEKLTALYSRLSCDDESIGDSLSIQNQKAKHLEQYDIYLKFKGKKALSEAGKILFKAAYSYLKDVMNGYTSLPIKA